MPNSEPTRTWLKNQSAIARHLGISASAVNKHHAHRADFPKRHAEGWDAGEVAAYWSANERRRREPEGLRKEKLLKQLELLDVRIALQGQENESRQIELDRLRAELMPVSESDQTAHYLADLLCWGCDEVLTEVAGKVNDAAIVGMVRRILDEGKQKIRHAAKQPVTICKRRRHGRPRKCIVKAE